LYPAATIRREDGELGRVALYVEWRGIGEPTKRSLMTCVHQRFDPIVIATPRGQPPLSARCVIDKFETDLRRRNAGYQTSEGGDDLVHYWTNIEAP